MVARLSELPGPPDQQFRRIQGPVGGSDLGSRKRRKAPAGGLRLRTDGQADEGPVQGRQPWPAAALGRGKAAFQVASNASRCATPCAEETRKPTGLPTKPWTREWAGLWVPRPIHPWELARPRQVLAAHLRERAHTQQRSLLGRSSKAMSRAGSCIYSKVTCLKEPSLRRNCANKRESEIRTGTQTSPSVKFRR